MLYVIKLQVLFKFENKVLTGFVTFFCLSTLCNYYALHLEVNVPYIT